MCLKNNLTTKVLYGLLIITKNVKGSWTLQVHVIFIPNLAKLYFG